MESKKQTAVEWLYELSKKRELDKFDLEQAKEMEKNQIEKACYDGYYQEELYDVRKYYDEIYK